MSGMRLARLVTLAAALAAGALTPSAAAKEFGPGDLRLCDAKRCVSITAPAVLPALSRFYYSDRPPRIAPSPRLGVPTLELRFENDYVTGIVGYRSFDRFLSYGVHLGYFKRDRWHAIPPRISAELRRLAATLEPIPLTRAALRRSR
jgi:hypothetical protein